MSFNITVSGTLSTGGGGGGGSGLPEPTAPPTGTATISLVKRSAYEAAPEAMWFQVAVTGAAETQNLTAGNYDPLFHRSFIIWDFGDSGAVSDKVVNLPSVHNDLNRAYGTFASHVYTSPGTYTVTCMVFDLDWTFVGSDTLEVTVSDPDTVFSGTKTICYSAAGTYTNKPTGAQEATSWADALTKLEALGTEGRILLRRGESYSLTAYQVASANVSNFYLGAFDTGAKPDITWSDAQGIRLNSALDCTLTGLAMDLGWDSTTEAGSNTGSGQYALRSQAGVGNAMRMLMDDCTVTGGGYALSVLGSNTDTSTRFTCIHNTRVTNWAVYGIYAGGSLGGYLSLLGCAFDQDEQAMMGGRGSFGNFVSNEEGPVRITSVANVIIDACDIFSRTSWTRIGSSGCPGVQASIRLQTSPVNNQTRSIITRNSIEAAGIAPRHATGGTRYSMNVLIDKNLLVGYCHDRRIVEVDYDGFTIRNNLFVRPQAPKIDGVNGFERYIALYGTTPDISATWKNQVYNNSFVSLLESSLYRGSFTHVGNGDDVITNVNNVLAALNGGPDGETGLNLTTNTITTVGGTIDGNSVTTWTPRFLGLKWNAYSGLLAPAKTTMDTAYATPTTSVKDYRPGSGSIATAACTGAVAACDDFFGTYRPTAIASRARGASEPS